MTKRKSDNPIQKPIDFIFKEFIINIKLNYNFFFDKKHIFYEIKVFYIGGWLVGNGFG